MTEPTRRQIQALGFVALLSPATRLLPGDAARAAGHAGWLGPMIALPFCALAACIVSAALSHKAPGEGLGEVILRRFPHLGRVFLGLYALWLALYAGFSVRSGASRFIYTIYTGASPWLFVAAGLALGLAAALGSVRRLARTAEIFRPLLLCALAAILAAGLARADYRELLPVSFADAPGLARGALTVFGTLCFALVNVPLLETGDRIAHRGRSMSLWCARECLFLAAVIAAVLGLFGPDLSGSMTYPFFALVRNVGLFNIAERIEALITALWVLSDFILAALSLTASARLARLALRIRSAPDRPLLLTSRALTTYAAAALALACAITAAPDSRTLRYLSDTLVVYVNLIMCALMLAFSAFSAQKR